MHHTGRQHLALIADLARALQQASDVDDALTRALRLLCVGLPVPAGLIWRVDPAGQWLLIAAHGDETVVDTALAHQPEPAVGAETVHGSRAGTVGPLASNDTSIVVTSPAGERIAALRLLDGSGETDRSEWPWLLEAVTALLEQSCERLRDRARLTQIQQVAAIGHWELRVDTDRVYLCEQMYRNVGTDPQRMEHTLAGYLARVHPDDRDEVAQQARSALADGGPWHTVHRMVADDGEVRTIEGHGQVAVDEQGRVVRLWGTGQDITRRRILEEELANLADRDELTGLVNRRAFQRHLEHAVTTRAGEGEATAVALVDIDDFRSLNEHFGWEVGDGVLQEVAGRLLELGQATLVARLSADEFALLFTPPTKPLQQLAEGIARTLRHPTPPMAEGRVIETGVGIAANVDDVATTDQLLQAASVALQVAKNRTTARWQVFDRATHGQALQRLAMEADLRRAVDEGQIDLAYQPILALGSGRITGVEALARWHRPGQGPVSPATFIPIAERTGLMPRLGRDVLEQACRQLRAWEEEHPRAADLRLGVNLSAIQLDDPDLVDTVEAVLARHGLTADRLVLEVTESTLGQDTPGALARLYELRGRGVRIAIDDFGTGYSSLARLRELPFDILKIDRSFIRDLASRHEPTPILGALFSISRSLGLDVVAEGVETPAQLAVMLGHGCGFVQGFLFSRPVPPGQVAAMLADATRWDPAAMAGEVGTHTTSPRLQQLFHQLAAAGGTPPHELLDEILDGLAERTGLETIYLTRIDFRGNVQEVIAASNRGAIRIEAGLQVSWSDTLCLRALAADDPVIRDPQRTHPDAEIACELGIGTYVGVAVHGPRGGLRGTLCGVTSADTDVSEETVETLRWASRLLADYLEEPGDDHHDSDRADEAAGPSTRATGSP